MTSCISRGCFKCASEHEVLQALRTGSILLLELLWDALHLSVGSLWALCHPESGASGGWVALLFSEVAAKCLSQVQIPSSASQNQLARSSLCTP